jgi:hypothetical protein
MPELVSTVTLTIGFALVKHMLSKWLGDSAQTQAGQDLLDLCRDQLLQWAGGKEERTHVERLAQQVVADMTPLWRHESRSLDDGAKTAVVLALGHTIARSRIDAPALIGNRLDAERLATSLAQRQAQQTQGFGDDEGAAYRRLLLETSRRIIYLAGHLAGYAALIDRHTLLTLEDVLDNLLQLRTGPAEAAREFEAAYRRALPIALDRFDAIGIPYAEDVLRRQSLNMAYVGLRLEQDERTAPLDSELRRLAGSGLFDEDERAGRMKSLGPRMGTIQEILALSPRLVIRGQPGSGKSTLLRWLAVRSSRRQLGEDSAPLASWDDAVPFYLRLRSTARQGGVLPNPREWPQLNDLQLALEPPSTWMHDVLDSGRGLVLLDGVDEVAVPQRQSLLAGLQKLVDTYPRARYVITSRSAAIKNWAEWNDWTAAQGFLAVALQEMEQEQVFAFIDQWHSALLAGERREEERAKIGALPAALKQMLRSRLPLRRLARNPLLCTMICALHRERPHNMPQNRVKLYQDCVEMLLYKRDSERGVGSLGDFPPLTHTHEEVVLREYAYHLLLNGESEEAAVEVDGYFNQLLESIHMPGWSGPLLRRYFVERTGLLIEPAEEQIAFAHRTFQEYLAAKVVVKKNEIKLLLRNARDDQWRETILLAVAVPEINEQQSEDLLRGLLKEAEASSKPRSRQELILLAVACLESPIYLSTALRAEVMARAAVLIPPRSDDTVVLIAKAGDPVVELLQVNEHFDDKSMARCVSALAEIGSERALGTIAAYRISGAYSENRNFELRRAIGAAIWRFDPNEYCQRVLRTAAVLDLSYTQVSDAGLAHLADLANLQALYLMSTQVSDVGLAHLVYLTNLQALNLTQTQVRDAGLAHLAYLTNLRVLNLRYAQVSDAGLAHLAYLTNLRVLNLSDTQVSDAGLAHLANLANLQALNLSNTQVSDAGLAHLASLANLQALYLSGTKVSDAGLAHLAGLGNLQVLYLMYTRVKDTSVLNHLLELEIVQ